MRVDGHARTIGQLLNDAIRHLVAEAIQSGGIIRIGPEAARLANTYTGSGLSTAEISELVMRAAVSAGVTTELCPPD